MTKYLVTLEDCTPDQLVKLNPILNSMFEFRANVVADDDESHEFYKKHIDEMEKIICS